MYHFITIMNRILVFLAEVTESMGGVKWNILGHFGTVLWGNMETHWGNLGHLCFFFLKISENFEIISLLVEK